MSQTASTYQRFDLDIVRSWFDATLTATLNTFYSWAGFFGPKEDMGTSLQEPIADPDLPVAGAPWFLSYAQEPPRSLSGSMLTRQGILHLTIRHQPESGEAAHNRLLDAVGAIKDRIQTLSTANAFAVTAAPLGPVALRNRWPEADLLFRLWLD